MGRLMLAGGLQLNRASDYCYRHISLDAMPWYFFVAACEASTKSDESTLPWREYGSQRHPNYVLGRPEKVIGYGYY